MRPLILAVCLLVGGQALADEATLRAGRELTEDFQQERFDALWERMTEEMRAGLETQDALGALHDALAAQAGGEVRVLSETADEEDGFKIYLRTAKHEKADVPVVTQWMLDPQDRIAGFFVRPAQQPAESRFLDYRTKADLRLPFDGEWYVFWGGRTTEQNYHAANPAQRFAYDFLVMRDGSTHEGDGTDLEQYYCWDEPILAPADGTVVSVTEDLPDLPIGEMDTENPAGNHVVLDLGNDEYVFLAHLREASVTVEESAAVQQGQEIGRCGNSGNTSEPHLHVHLQNSPDLVEGEGLPAFFSGYAADGEPVESGEPTKGQTVSTMPE